jgi:hypothetical protein
MIERGGAVGPEPSTAGRLGSARAPTGRGLAEVAGEAGDLLEVGRLGMGRQMADLHVLEQALLAKWRDRTLL